MQDYLRRKAGAEAIVDWEVHSRDRLESRALVTMMSCGGEM